MKKTAILLITTTMYFSCKAQVLPLFNNEDGIFNPNSTGYYKDVDNDFNKFVGEWKWENQNSEFIVVLEKAVNIDDGDNYTFDALYGEYKYLENDAVIFNTLQDINNPTLTPFDHKIYGAIIMSNNFLPQCTSCLEGERRVKVTIEHPEFPETKGSLVMRHVTENGVEKIYAVLLDDSDTVRPENAPENLPMPYGEYIFVKQD